MPTPTADESISAPVTAVPTPAAPDPVRPSNDEPRHGTEASSTPGAPTPAPDGAAVAPVETAVPTVAASAEAPLVAASQPEVTSDPAWVIAVLAAAVVTAVVAWKRRAVTGLLGRQGRPSDLGLPPASARAVVLQAARTETPATAPAAADALPGALTRSTPTPTVGGTTYQQRVPQVLPEQVVIDATVGASASYGRAVGFDVRAACVRGLDHASSGEGGDDVAGLVHAGGALYAVVCDGMGSQEGSREVARQAVGGFTRAARGAAGDPGQVLGASVEAAADAARAALDNVGSGATTLVAVALVASGPVTLLHAACIGDSAVLVRRADGTLEVLVGEVDSGGGTRGLPQHTDAVLVSLELDPADAVILATDGFHAALTAGSELTDHVVARWSTAPKPIDFLDAVAFDGDYFYDDRSAVGAWRATSS